MHRSSGASPRVLRSVATLLLILLIAVALVGVGPIVAAPVAAPAPTAIAGNPTCDSVGQDTATKVDPPDIGTHEFTAGGKLYAVQLYDKDVPTSGFISFNSVDKGNGQFIFHGVIVKGGPNANFYYYPSGTTGDTGLSTPNGGSSDVSHLEFCYSQLPPTATATATNTATATATNTATATATNTATATATSTATATGTPVATATSTHTPVPGATNTPTPTNTPQPPPDPTNTPQPPPDPTNTPQPQQPDPDPTATPVPPTATPVPPTATPAPVLTVLPAAPAPQPVLVQLPATGLGGAAPIDPPLAGLTIAMLSAIRLMLAVRGGRRDR